jgi:molybdopterin molybdotransferase
MRHDEALAILRQRLAPIASEEEIALSDAVGRIAAREIVSPRNIPGFDNSAVDGYAFNAAAHKAADTPLRVTVRIAAGDRVGLSIALGEAARIFTGAPMPDGADTVAMQEDCEVLADERVRIPAGLKVGANRRRAGEDVKAGSTVVAPGRVLRPQDIAQIASTGAATLKVFERLRVGLISSGNELRRPGQPLGDNGVYDANHFLLRALLHSLPVATQDLGILPDDAALTRRTVTEAANRCDVLLSSGGASLGEEDHLSTAIAVLGTRHVWQLAVKPGRPMAFGQIGTTACFGLPGNPVAAFVCFLLYVQPALIRLGGGRWTEPARFSVPAAFSFADKKQGRREFWRGELVHAEDGTQRVKKFARDGSGLISGLRAADGLIEVGEDVTGVREGQPVSFIPFSEFGIT